MEKLEEVPPPHDRWLRWFVVAIIFSFAVHLGFVRWAKQYQIKTLSEAYYETIVPRAFKVDRVEIDPKLLQEEEAKQSDMPSISPVPLEVPAENIAAEMPETRPAPAKPKQLDIDKEPLPQVGSPAASADPNARSTAMLQEDLKAMREALLSDTPASAAQPAIELAASVEGTGVGGLSRGVPAGYSNLDDLLASSGGISEAQAPIFMPSDVLFDYDQSSLQVEAIVSLKKLAELIRRNPQARFRIEGHTDSFGGPEYNAKLSLARAESVQQWLVEQMAIAPHLIDVRGLGSSRPLAPLTGTIEEQKLNRRVEIVILNGAPGT